MTADLHARLVAAVQQRLDVARAATPGPWRMHGGWMVDGDAHCLSLVATDGFKVLRPMFPDSDMIATADDLEFLVSVADPATVVRHCERDLAVLRRHAATGRVCDRCSNDWHTARWPCPEILDLAAAYGIDPAVEVDRG